MVRGLSLPHANRLPGSLPEITLLQRIVVIVGPNGAGKSKLGYWIEQHNGPVHRIAAQRSLVFNDDVQPEPYDRAELSLYYGGGNRGDARKPNRWGDPQFATSTLLNDFDQLLSLLFAHEHKRNKEYVERSKSAKNRIDVPESKLEALHRVWASIMPQRELVIGNDKLEAKSQGKLYRARVMSDGERVALYLIGQSLCAPDDAIIVIDEPEIHLHRAIQASLWDKVESERNDCMFVYITHDLEPIPLGSMPYR